VEIVIVIILAVGLVLVSAIAVVAMLWMRRQEQKQDFAMKNADTLLRLEDALNRALKEIDMKKQALLSQYKPVLHATDDPSLFTLNEIAPPIKRGRGRPRKTPIVVNTPAESLDEAATHTRDADSVFDTAPVQAPAPKPIPRKQSQTSKHQKVLELRAQGMIIPDIAKKLSLNQGAVTLILDTAEKRSESE